MQLLVADQFVDHGDIAAELAHVLGFELADLEFDHHVTQLFDVEQQQVDEAIDPVHLPACKSHAASEFEQRVLEAVHQRLLQVVLGEALGQGCDLEHVRILGQLLRQIDHVHGLLTVEYSRARPN